MRFLADENVPLASVRTLRAAGHDVLAVSESAAGAADAELIQRAADEHRVVITFDRDFGGLVFRGSRPLPAGVVLFRFQPSSPDEPGDVLNALALRPELDFEARFTIVERDRVRQRPFPRRV